MLVNVAADSANPSPDSQTSLISNGRVTPKHMLPRSWTPISGISDPAALSGVQAGAFHTFGDVKINPIHGMATTPLHTALDTPAPCSAAAAYTGPGTTPAAVQPTPYAAGAPPGPGRAHTLAHTPHVYSRLADAEGAAWATVAGTAGSGMRTGQYDNLNGNPDTPQQIYSVPGALGSGDGQIYALAMTTAKKEHPRPVMTNALRQGAPPHLQVVVSTEMTPVRGQGAPPDPHDEHSAGPVYTLASIGKKVSAPYLVPTPAKSSRLGHAVEAAQGGSGHGHGSTLASWARPAGQGAGDYDRADEDGSTGRGGAAGTPAGAATLKSQASPFYYEIRSEVGTPFEPVTPGNPNTPGARSRASKTPGANGRTPSKDLELLRSNARTNPGRSPLAAVAESGESQQRQQQRKKMGALKRLQELAAQPAPVFQNQSPGQQMIKQKKLRGRMNAKIAHASWEQGEEAKALVNMLVKGASKRGVRPSAAAGVAVSTPGTPGAAPGKPQFRSISPAVAALGSRRGVGEPVTRLGAQ